MNVNEMISELQKGEAARARVPELEELLSGAQKRIDELASHNQGLEENIIRYKAEITQANSEINTLRNERDAALLKEMEAEEKLNSFRKVVREISDAISHKAADLDDANASLNPPAPIPPVVPVEEQKAVSEVLPEPYGEPIKAVSIPITEGQSEASPMSVGGTENSSQDALSHSVGQEVSATTNPSPVEYRPFSPPPAPKPYEGKFYYEKPASMTWREWTEGGGELAYWRDRSESNLSKTD